MRDYVTIIWASKQPLGGYASFARKGSWSTDQKIVPVSDYYLAWKGNLATVPANCRDELKENYEPLFIRVQQTITFVKPEEILNGN